MNDKLRRIIFAGDFSVFESLREVQQRTIDDALELDADIAIFVEDLGVGDKLAAYIKGGIEAVKDVYRFRREDCGSRCVIVQLPSENELDLVIDVEQYEKALRMLVEEDLGIVEFLKENDTERDNGAYLKIHAEYQRILRERIVPELVLDRVKKYGLVEFDVKLYSERKLRNFVRHRVKKTGPMGWRNIQSFRRSGGQISLGSMIVVNHRGIPICRGIMVALYEQVAAEGYNELIQYCPKEYYLASTKAQLVYQAVAEQLPQTRGRNMQFIYRWY